MILFYFIFVSALYLGFFKLPYPGIIHDLIFSPLIVYSLYNGIKVDIDNKITRYFYYSWFAFIIYNTILFLMAIPFYSKATSFLNIRGVYPFLLFFITIKIINSKQKLYWFLNFILIAVLVAGLFSLLQSIDGPKPMFDPEQYYDIGHWPGQGSQMIGPIARVMLPTIYSIYVVFICLILWSIINGKLNFLPLILSLLLPVLISYARSMWMSIIVSLLCAITFIFTKKIFNFKKIIKIVVLLGLITIILLIILNNDNQIGASVVERILSGFSDYNEKSGTYGIRLLNIMRFLTVWYSSGFYFGVDPFFMFTMKEPALSDVGYVYVLVTSGISGMILLMNLWLATLLFSINCINLGKKIKENELIFSGVALFAIIIFFICSQIYTQYVYTSSLFAIVCGLAMAVRQLCLK